MKYNEKEILKQIEEYIESTYSQHYSSDDNIQVNDLIMAIGHGEGSFIANAIEYLARYGKKEGKNQKDLFKAIHNIIFLLYLNHQEKDEVITDSKQLTFLTDKFSGDIKHEIRTLDDYYDKPKVRVNPNFIPLIPPK